MALADRRALAACTAGPAHVDGVDDAASPRAGNPTDPVVPDRDTSSPPPQEIAEADVVLTYV
ncbi:hypothetical protein [Streptomyces sp. NPDC002463]|uniref:hypothetical protein n=1 Tax=Streptomyces sp. NPDC002463 TaxID=3364645 RepID=UPI0036BE0360